MGYSASPGAHPSLGVPKVPTLRRSRDGSVLEPGAGHAARADAIVNREKILRLDARRV